MFYNYPNPYLDYLITNIPFFDPADFMTMYYDGHLLVTYKDNLSYKSDSKCAEGRQGDDEYYKMLICCIGTIFVDQKYN